jgi:hypothetical protein
MRSPMRPSLAVILVSLALIVGCSSTQDASGTADPASTGQITTDSAVSTILVKSCYKCHSTGGRAPWYAALSPTYLASNSAREALNFSDWQNYDSQKLAEMMKSIEQSVSSGSMPPGDYAALDWSARLSQEQKETLLKWAAQPALPVH